MPALKAKDLRSLSTDELGDRAEGIRKELFQLRLQAKVGKLEDTSKMRKLSRDLAKVLTVKNEMRKK